MSICSGIAVPCSLPTRFVPISTIHGFMFSDADLLEMHRRMLVIRGFEERVAALYRDGEVPGFVHLSIGQEASAVGACWPLGPADVITSTHRGHGHCLAKGLDPLGMFAELMAKDAGHEPRARRLDAHRRSRRSASSAPTGSWAPACRSRSGAATAAQLRGDGTRRGRVLRRRRGRARHVPRSDQPRRGLAAAGDLLLREQRLRRVLARVDAARGAARAARRRLRRRLRRGRRQRRRGDRGRDARRWSTRRAPDAVPSSSRPTTYRWHGHYEGDPQRYRSPDEVRGVGGARPAARPRAPAPIGGRRRRRARGDASRRSRASSTTPSRRRGGWRRPRPRR